MTSGSKTKWPRARLCLTATLTDTDAALIIQLILSEQIPVGLKYNGAYLDLYVPIVGVVISHPLRTFIVGYIPQNTVSYTVSTPSYMTWI